jgi:hypothetical protein
MQEHLHKGRVMPCGLIFEQSDVSHCRLYSLDTETVFDTNRQAVKGPKRLSLSLEEIV